MFQGDHNKRKMEVELIHSQHSKKITGSQNAYKQIKSFVLPFNEDIVLFHTDKAQFGLLRKKRKKKEKIRFAGYLYDC